MKQLKSLLILFVGVVFVSIFLSACGGGGGGGGPTPPPPPPPSPEKSSVNIRGVVVQGLSPIVGSSIKKSQEQEKAAIPNAIVEVIAYDKNDKKTGEIKTTTLSTGTFNTSIDLSTKGGYIVINIYKEGFASYSKRIDFEKPSDVNIQAELDSVIPAIAKREDAIFRASTGERVIKFAVFKKPTGQKVVKVGREAEIMKQNGNQPILEIEIPVNTIPEDVNTLVAQLQTFDPIENADRFPGQYMDDKGNRLVSLGFDFINITDDKGKNLGEVVAQAIKQGKLKKAQTNSTRISRWIDSNSCGNLLKDFCTGSSSDDPLCEKLNDDEKNGFNVPVYTYNPYSGLWEMLGIGTIDKDGNGTIDDNDVINDDRTEDGVVDEKDYQAQCKNNNGTYLLIFVTNEEFSRNWWNLDYPLIFEEPKELCVVATFKDSDGKPIEGLWVYMYDDDSTWSFSSAWGSTDSDGKVRLSTVLTNNNDPDRTAKIGYYDPFDWSWKEDTVDLGESPNCIAREITIEKPRTCQVEGYVKDEEGNGVADQYVYAYGISTLDYRYAYTDRNGYFSMDVQCEIDYDLYVGWSWERSRVFNVNGTVDPDENRDENDKVTLKDVIMENQEPYAYGWLSSTSIFAGDTITAYIYGWDNECDAPMTWKIKHESSIINEGTTSDCWFYEFRDITFSEAGTYNLTLYVTDSKGKETSYPLGTVVVSAQDQNRSPIIQYAYPSTYRAGKGTTITLYGSAYDFDGDNLSWKWYANGTEISNCSDSGSSSIYTTCPYTTPNVDGSVTIKFEVSDGRETVYQKFTISVGDTGSVGIIIQGNKGGRR